jgi:hypothetical protein
MFEGIKLDMAVTGEFSGAITNWKKGVSGEENM